MSRVIFTLFAVVVVTLCQSSRQVSAWLDGEVLVEIQNVLHPSRADLQWEKPVHVWLQGGPYDIYVAKRDQERCMHYCRWRVEEEGLYSLSNKNGIWENLCNWPQ
ncbi:hypothetical protein FF1_037644 [Malus domestica]